MRLLPGGRGRGTSPRPPGRHRTREPTPPTSVFAGVAHSTIRRRSTKRSHGARDTVEADVEGRPVSPGVYYGKNKVDEPPRGEASRAPAGGCPPWTLVRARAAGWRLRAR